MCGRSMTRTRAAREKKVDYVIKSRKGPFSCVEEYSSRTMCQKVVECDKNKESK